jgi:hypothetical protein
MQRRTLLKVGIAGGAVLGMMAGGAALLFEPAWRDGRLTESGRRVFGAVARAVLDGRLPADVVAMQSAVASHLDRIEATVRAMPPASQRDVANLVTLLAMAPGRIALAGLPVDWPNADAALIQDSLQAMRTSRIALRQQAYHALRDLTHAAYFADRATWSQLGYPGPTTIE